MIALLLLACTDGDTGDKAGCQDLVLTDDMNYSYTGTLDFPEYEAQAHAIITVDWSRLTKDMLCHDMTSADVLSAGLSLFPHLDHTELTAGLVADSLLSSDLAGYINSAITGQTSLPLDEMTFNGEQVDVASLFEENDEASWLFNLSSGESYDDAILFPAFLTPKDDSTVTTVYLEDSCDIVNYEFDLESLTKLSVDSGSDLCNLDWSGLVYSGHGDFLKPNSVNEILVAHYPDKTPADLEAEFLDLELIADGMWTESVNGDNADLSGLADADGNAFPGVDTTGTWVLALRDTTSRSPAPLFLTVLDVK